MRATCIFCVLFCPSPIRFCRSIYEIANRIMELVFLTWATANIKDQYAQFKEIPHKASEYIINV